MGCEFAKATCAPFLYLVNIIFSCIVYQNVVPLEVMMRERWYIEASQLVRTGAIVLIVDASTIACPYMLLHVEKDQGMYIFTFRGRSVGETIVCRTKSLKERPKCYINGKKKYAPRTLIPFCRSDTKVVQVP